MLASFFFVDVAMLYKPWILPHFQLLSKSVYTTCVGRRKMNEMGEVNGGKYPERNQLDMFKSAGSKKSYVAIWGLCKECFDTFFLICFFPLPLEPIVITSLFLTSSSSPACCCRGYMSSLSLEMERTEEQTMALWWSQRHICSLGSGGGREGQEIHILAIHCCIIKIPKSSHLKQTLTISHHLWESGM